MTAHLAASTTGGYEYQFLTTPADWLMCNICHHPSREPHLSVCCGHTFCKSCLDGIKQSKISNACPMCRNEEFNTFYNKQADRTIRSLRVSCTNKERGCKWEGEVNSITCHLEDRNGCLFQDVKCPNHCRVILQRQCLAGHVANECVRRQVSCKHCHFAEEYRIVEGGHMEKCPKLPLPCPNSCEVLKIPREAMDNHRKTCPLEIVACANNCGVTLQRRQLANHTKVECLLQIIGCQHCQIGGERRFIEGDHKKECLKFPLPCPNKCDATRISREDINKHRAICPLETVSCLNNCGITLQRQDVAVHIETDCPLENVKCQFCDTPGQRQMIEGQHLKLCLNVPLPCPNSCEVGSIPRSGMDDHMKVCLLEPIHCEYHVVGCTKKIARKDQAKHSKNYAEKHLSLIKHELTTTKEKFTSDQKKLAAKEEFVAFQLEVKAFKDDLNVKVTQVRQEILGHLNTTNNYCKDLKTRLEQTQGELNQTRKELCATDEKLKTSEEELKDTKAKFQQEIDACNQKLTDFEQQLIVNQKALLSTKTELTITKDLLKATQQTAQKTKDELIQNLTDTEMLLKRNVSDVEAKLQQQEKTRQIDCIKFNKWYRSIYTLASKVSSGDLVAPVVVTMPEYSHKRKEQEDWYSSSFYTHHKGYRLCVNICITPPHMSVGLLLMKGPHDEKLKWPMKGHCEVKLLNQITNSEHHSKFCVDTLSNGRRRVNRGERNTYHMWSLTKFITDEELQKITATCQYLKDDNIFLQIDYKPHA